MELLVETYTPNEANILMESSKDGKNVYLSGRFMAGGVKNKNNRVYPVTEIVNAVRSLNEMIEEQGCSGCELDHPQNRLNTELKYVCAGVTEIHMDGDNAIGKMKIFNTPNGKIVKALASEGLRMGVSSRGAGTVSSEGIVEGFVIQAIDIVSQPSGPGCVPNSIYESLDSKLGSKVLSLSEAVQHDVNAQKYFIKEIRKFLKHITD